jgi:hypothetical protein
MHTCRRTHQRHGSTARLCCHPPTFGWRLSLQACELRLGQGKHFRVCAHISTMYMYMALAACTRWWGGGLCTTSVLLSTTHQMLLESAVQGAHTPATHSKQHDVCAATVVGRRPTWPLAGPYTGWRVTTGNPSTVTPPLMCCQSSAVGHSELTASSQ